MIFKHIMIALLAQHQETLLLRKRARGRKWYKENSERLREYARKYYSRNPGRCQEAMRKWRLKNPGGCRKATRKWRLENSERYRGTMRKWRLRNSEPRKAYKRAWNLNRRQTDSNFRIRLNIRSRINQVLRGKIKSGKTLSLLGCTIPKLKLHLEQKFRPGMTWENYGPVWHADHIRPCASFDLTDPEQQKLCFHYSNLQPLFAEENLLKGAKY